MCSTRSTGSGGRFRPVGLSRRLAGVVTLMSTIALWVLAASPGSAAEQAAAGQRWVGTWATAPVAMIPPSEPPPPVAGDDPPLGAPPPRVNNQTLRQVVRVSAGGAAVRIALSNTFGTEPVDIGAAHVAYHDTGAAIDATRGAPLTFAGHGSVTVEVGSIVVSDPVPLQVAPLAELAIDLYVPADTWATDSPATGHGLAWATTYLSTPGDHTGEGDLPVQSTAQSWFYLTRVDVLADADTAVVVAFGDSITEGFGSTPDANHRWPDLLAARLEESQGDDAPAVLNAAISGNRVLGHNGLPVFLRRELRPGEENADFGPSAVSRFDRDVLLLPGATHVVILESINDIGLGGDQPEPTVDQLIAAHRALIQRARARGLIVYGGTLTPFEGAAYYTETGERKRQAVNEWIRTSGAYDAVIDFDAVLRDPSHPSRFQPDLHAGDWLHPNDAGYTLMANAVDLDLFAPRSESEAAQATAEIELIAAAGRATVALSSFAR